MDWKLGGLAIAVAIGGANITSAAERMTPAERAAAAQQIIRSAKTLVRAHLKDPESARFRRVGVYATADNQLYVCGQFSAKNAFGGYVGFEDFVVNAQTAELTRKDEILTHEQWENLNKPYCTREVYLLPD